MIASRHWFSTMRSLVSGGYDRAKIEIEMTTFPLTMLVRLLEVASSTLVSVFSSDKWSLNHYTPSTISAVQGTKCKGSLYLANELGTLFRIPLLSVVVDISHAESSDISIGPAR